MWVLLDCGTPNVPRHQCYFAWFECGRLRFLPCCRAAGAVLSLRTRALLTGHITQVALSVTHVLSCKRRTTVKQRVFSPEKTNFKITLCFLQCLPFFFKFVYQLRYVFAHFFLSFFLSSLLEWLELSLWCVLVAPIINSQLFLFSLRWRSSSLSSSFWHLPHKNSFSVCCRLLFVLFLYHVQILFVGFETKHCTVWKCHSLANSLWVFLQ